jgi:membrane protease YdiL (CAAX protease family)
MNSNEALKIRSWLARYHLLTILFIFLFLSLTVGNIYVGITGKLLFDLGLTGIGGAILSVASRFIISFLALFIVLPLLLYQSPRPPEDYRKELKFVPGISWKRAIVAGLLSFIIYAFISITTLLLLGIFPDDPFVFLRKPNETSIGWLWLIFAINPAIFEEMGFRGVLLSNLERKYSEKQAIWITSLLFGVFHFTSLVNGSTIDGTILIVFLATSFSLSWTYSVAKTKSVVPGMIMHYLINAFQEVLFTPQTLNQDRLLIHLFGLFILYPILSIVAVKFYMRGIRE